MLVSYAQKMPEVDASAFVAPTAVLIGRVTVGQRSSIWFNCVLRADINVIEIGTDTNIQDGCLLHVTSQYQCIIGDRVTVGHGAIVHGCRIESDCLIAMGAVVLDGAIVGSGSIVAAGAVVSPGSAIPAGSLVMGVPGKVVRGVSSEDRTRIERGWQNYVQYAATYKNMSW
ncbi:MAG TPA: gamma carbonic anhydrase family protein [Candidatus Obscuribacterales bacterium]